MRFDQGFERDHADDSERVVWLEPSVVNRPARPARAGQELQRRDLAADRARGAGALIDQRRKL
jgi:hypothetical protein